MKVANLAEELEKSMGQKKRKRWKWRKRGKRKRDSAKRW
jgi:hypothetical protein